MFQRVKHSSAAREANSALERGQRLDGPAGNLAAIDTRVMGTTAVNEFRVAWGRDRFQRDPVGCEGCATLNYPSIRLGKPNNAPLLNQADHFQLADVLSWHRANRLGRQTFKVGFTATVGTGRFGSQPDQTGTYTFSRNLPFDPANKLTYPTRFVQSFGQTEVPLNQSIASAFFQDEWQPRDVVTLNLGVRWDHTRWPGPSGLHEDVAPRVGVSIESVEAGHDRSFGRHLAATTTRSLPSRPERRRGRCAAFGSTTRGIKATCAVSIRTTPTRIGAERRSSSSHSISTAGRKRRTPTRRAWACNGRSAATSA